MRAGLVSFSVNRSSTPGSKRISNGPTRGERANTADAPRAASEGFSLPPNHDQVLRAQNCGKIARDAASGPRLIAEIRITQSSTPAFAYSTVTSK